MNEVGPSQNVQNRIYKIRGQQVMLDADLAELYDVRTGQLNRAVNRNIDQFPEDFIFQLNRVEIMRICQIGISYGFDVNIKFSKRVTVFTEQGIGMLSHQGIASRVEKLEGKVSILDTDVRLMAQDIDGIKKIPRLPERRIKGFSKD